MRKSRVGPGSAVAFWEAPATISFGIVMAVGKEEIRISKWQEKKGKYFAEERRRGEEQPVNVTSSVGIKEAQILAVGFSLLRDHRLPKDVQAEATRIMEERIEALNQDREESEDSEESEGEDGGEDFCLESDESESDGSESDGSESE